MYTPIKKQITAAGYVAVTLPTGHSCSSYSLWTEDGAAFYVAGADDSSGTNGVLVTTDGTNGFALTINEVRGAGATICYAKGTSTTNLVGLITKD